MTKSEAVNPVTFSDVETVTSKWTIAVDDALSVTVGAVRSHVTEYVLLAVLFNPVTL